MLRGLFLALCAISLAGFSACAYHFQGARNTLKDLGIQRIYVTNFGNKTYRPGIEQLFTTAMVREIARAGAFSLVNSEKQADAVLSGEVTAAAGVGANALVGGSGDGFTLQPVSTTQQAGLNFALGVASFELRPTAG